MLDLPKRQKQAALVLVLALAVGGIVLFVRGSADPPIVVYPGPLVKDGSGEGEVIQSKADYGNLEIEGQLASGSAEKPKPEDLVVHVCGAVKNPGVYTLSGGMRIKDAVEAAGGLEDSAIQEAINMATKLTDSMQIYIPERSGTFESDTGEADIVLNAFANDKVNINTATSSRLQDLIGIGPALAKRILDFRAAGGRFDCPEDIMKIPGIGTKKYADLKDLITVH
ncbi:MAG: hypothetical protein GX969_01825 [Firmicutes bacterium]|nr:hypothetical protein [Bacillota bacterium]